MERARPFIKMHGLGNDFVVVDARRVPFPLDAAAARRIAERREGIGCDQIIVMEPPEPGSGADVFMRIRNADGGEVSACGNATRCVAARLLAEGAGKAVMVQTRAGLLRAWDAGQGRIAVDMGPARTGWQEIPLAYDADTLHLPLARGPLADPVAVSMGNPHAVFFIADTEQIDLETLGPELEHDPIFPERANISLAQVMGAQVTGAQVMGPEAIRLRVWERGVGITRACGTAACAAAVAGARRGLTGRRSAVLLDGGRLDVEWRESDGHVVMTGPAAESFTGEMNGSLLAA